jgi:hypothetical protein
MLASSTSPVTACPWNGCGTDAHNSYVASMYDYYFAAPADAPQVYGYAAPVYGYAGPVYGYAARAYGYASPHYYYGPRRSYAGAAFYPAPRAHVGGRRW